MCHLISKTQNMISKKKMVVSDLEGIGHDASCLLTSVYGIIPQMLHVGNIYLHVPLNMAIFHPMEV